MTTEKCRICSGKSTHFSEGFILDKYKINYFVCSSCGFVQTEEPFWLDEAYAVAINKGDTGLVGRNMMLAKVTKAIIPVLFDPTSKFMDYGGGYGLYVRLMRDAGFDFYRYDKYCENIFAKGFDINLEDKHPYELLTAFELFEHLINPLGEMKQMLSFSKNILFTTELIPNNNPKPDEWWYYGLDHGQHISFFTLKSLAYLADKLGLSLYSDSKSLHLLTPKKISSVLFKIITNAKMIPIINRINRRLPLKP